MTDKTGQVTKGIDLECLSWIEAGSVLSADTIVQLVEELVATIHADIAFESHTSAGNGLD